MIDRARTLTYDGLCYNARRVEELLENRGGVYYVQCLKTGAERAKRGG